MNILFTICGRAGSKGFKNKNLKLMNGVPLVYYTLSVIFLYSQRHLYDNIYIAVNTDSIPLQEMIKKQSIINGVLYVKRKEELAGDRVAKIEVIKDTYRSVDAQVDAVVDLDITSPLRTVKDIENAIDKYNMNDSYDLVTSVVNARRSPYFNMVEEKGGWYKKICASSYTTRQEAPASYELNASIYVYRPAFLEMNIEDTILDHRVGISVMKDYLVLDIDSEEDFEMMEILHRYYIEQDDELKKIYETAQKYVS